MASACILLAVMAAMLALSEAAEFGTPEFYAKDIPEQIVETADTNMDLKASVKEVFDLLTVLFYKTSEKELSLLDTNADGFLSAEELKIDESNTSRLREYVKPGHGDNLTLDEVLKFLDDRGVKFSHEFLHSDRGLNVAKENINEVIDFLFMESIRTHFMDISMIRSQLQFGTVMRLLILKSRLIEDDFNLGGAMEDGAWNAVRFIEFMNRWTQFDVDPNELPEWLTPEGIRRINVTRQTMGWPTPNANRTMAVDVVAAFMTLYGLGFGRHVPLPFAGPLEPEAADLDHDGLLSEAELQVWLDDSARVFFDESFFETMRDGIFFFLDRVANLLNRYLKRTGRSGL